MPLLCESSPFVLRHSCIDPVLQESIPKQSSWLTEYFARGCCQISLLQAGQRLGTLTNFECLKSKLSIKYQSVPSTVQTRIT